jgi:C4-dicarboxylate transporter DctM subunit
LFVSLVVLLIAGTPIAASLGLATVFAFLSQGQNLLLVPQRMFGGTDSFPLMAVPFFILAGNLMAAGGISRRIVDFANMAAGRLSGALAIASYHWNFYGNSRSHNYFNAHFSPYRRAFGH